MENPIQKVNARNNTLYFGMNFWARTVAEKIYRLYSIKLLVITAVRECLEEHTMTEMKREQKMGKLKCSW